MFLPEFVSNRVLFGLAEMREERVQHYSYSGVYALLSCKVCSSLIPGRCCSRPSLQISSPAQYGLRCVFSLSLSLSWMLSCCTTAVLLLYDLFIYLFYSYSRVNTAKPSCFVSCKARALHQPTIVSLLHVRYDGLDTTAVLAGDHRIVCT